MQIFDRIDPDELEKREWHLWMLVLATLLVFATAIGLLMYPAIFLNPVIVRGVELRKAFFGFCLLTTLLLAYLTNRQIILSRSRKKVYRTHEALLQAQKEASAILGRLPDLPLFLARLRAEFRRAVLGQQPFSVVMVSIQSAEDSHDTHSELIAVIVSALKRKVRGDDLVYLLAPRVFCIMLPGVTYENATSLTERVAKALRTAGATTELSFETKLLNYPELTNTLQAFEESARAFAGYKTPPPYIDPGADRDYSVPLGKDPAIAFAQEDTHPADTSRRKEDSSIIVPK